mgnify:CR=1 FL=1
MPAPIGALAVVVAYLLGGLPWGLILGRWLRGVDIRQRSRAEIDVAAARAETDHPDLAVAFRLRTQESHAAGDVAHDLRVRDAAFGAHPGSNIVGMSRSVTVIKMRRDGRKTVLRELACRLQDPFVPTGRDRACCPEPLENDGVS